MRQTTAPGASAHPPVGAEQGSSPPHAATAGGRRSPRGRRRGLFTSLRSKIFLLIGLTLLLTAALVMFTTQRDVTRSAIAMEEHAVRNVLNLLQQDSEARWGAFLHDKIATVRSNRSRLMQLGQTVESVMKGYLAQVRGGEISQARAQQLALQWLAVLSTDAEGSVWAFDGSYKVLTDDGLLEPGTDISAVLDYKGRPLAASVYQEVRTGAHGFAIYHLPDPEGGAQRLRYAYVSYLPEWDWVIAVSDDAEGVLQQFARRRADTEKSVADLIDGLRLAESGFAFIIGDDGRLVARPPAAGVGLLGAIDETSGKTLQGMLHELPPSADIQHLYFAPVDGDDTWRIHATYFRPLGWTIVGAVPERDFSRAATELRNRLGLFLLAVLAVALAVAGFVSLRLTRPLHQLSKFARALPEQDLSTERALPEHIARLSQRRADEVGRLAAAFTYMDAQLREKVARLLEETSSRERLESELNIAQQIQRGLLPPPPDAALRARVDLGATMVPAKEVGGDLYDYFLLPDGRLLFAIGDVSDKGVPAALFMAATCTLVRAIAETESDPAVIMARINDRLSANNPNLMFVTLVVGVVDLDSGRLEWANAGHSAPCVLTPSGELRLLEGRSGPACGVQEGLPYRRHDAHLACGELLLNFTDGVTEAVGPANAQFGEHRLYATLAPLAGSDAATALDTVLGHVHDFVRDTPQSDDITLLALRRLPT